MLVPSKLAKLCGWGLLARLALIFKHHMKESYKYLFPRSTLGIISCQGGAETSGSEKFLGHRFES